MLEIDSVCIANRREVELLIFSQKSSYEMVSHSIVIKLK